MQSNSEAALVEHIQAARAEADAIVINPAAYSFRSAAIVDAIRSFEGPVIELHVSNIHARDEMHRDSIISAVATAVICSLGPWGYLAAMLAAAQMLDAVADGFPEALRGAAR